MEAQEMKLKIIEVIKNKASVSRTDLEYNCTGTTTGLGENYGLFTKVLELMIELHEVETYLARGLPVEKYCFTEWYERLLDAEMVLKVRRAVEALEALGLTGRILGDGNPLVTSISTVEHIELLERLKMVACDARRFAIDAT